MSWTKRFERELLKYKNKRGIKNMEIDKILVELAEIVGKPKGILTRTYNQIKTEKEEAGLKAPDVLPEEQLQRVILAGLCEKYELPDDVLDKYIDDEDEEDGPPIPSDVKDYDDYEDNKDEGEEDWESIFSTTPKPRKFSSASGEKKFESTPLLPLIDRLSYKLKLFDPSVKSRHIIGINKYNNDYDSHLVDVTLVDISDPSLWEDVYESGDLKGEPLLIKGGKYTLWLDTGKGFPEFVALWRDVLGLSKPDSRPFYLKRYKKISKKGRKYNVFNFAIK